MRKGGGIWFAVVVFCLVGFALSVNRFHANKARASAPPVQTTEIEYAFGPMAPEQPAIRGTRLVPFRSVSSTGAIEVLPGIADRRLGDSVFKVRYGDGSELWLVAVDK